MSTAEKIIGMVAILAIGIVFVIVISVVVVYLGRWRQKGANPNHSFPRNPKGGGLSNEQQRALNVGAILAECNSDFCDSLQTSREVAIKEIREMMARDWGIQSAQEALETLDGLKYCGHRQIHSLILRDAPRLLAPGTKPPEDPRDIYRQTGFSLLDKRLLTGYPNEAALAEKNIDLIDELLKAPSFEDKYQERFGDERAFSICIQLYQRFHSQCLAYTHCINNLAQTLPDLRKEGFLGENLSALQSIDPAAWDLGRMVNVSRYCYELGYLSESQAWEYILFAQRESASRYADWAAFGRAYITGRALWGGKNLSLFHAMSAVEKLKTDKKSPWVQAPLH